MSNTKFEKRNKCQYCESDLDAKYRNKRFCSAKCRVYWNREKKYNNSISDLAKGTFTDRVALNRVPIEFTKKMHTEAKESVLSEMSDYEIRVAKERIKVLEHELAHPPTQTMIGISKWTMLRRNELNELKSKL